jgi:hypothetical protein
MVLNIVYRYDHYNRQSLKPNLVTPELYFRLYGKAMGPTTCESLGRKVRKICRALAERGLLARKADKSYVVARHLP